MKSVARLQNVWPFCIEGGTLDQHVKSSQELSKQEGVEFEPTKMIVVQDFIPCVDDELEVKRGQMVKALYQENEWRFVVAEDGREGFIPYTFCIPTAESTVKSKHGEQLLSQHVRHFNAIGNCSRPL
jgi:hypothetical protein